MVELFLYFFHLYTVFHCARIVITEVCIDHIGLSIHTADLYNTQISRCRKDMVIVYVYRN